MRPGHYRHGARSRRAGKISALVTLLVVCAVTTYILNRRDRTTEVPITAPAAAEISQAESQPTEKRATFMAVGDMLIHDTIYNDFKTSDGFDFDPVFEQVKPILSQGDFVALNQETPLGGEKLGLSGLKVANSPQELADAEVGAGFNIFQLANNHAMDRGEAGLNRTLDYFKKFDDIITSGAYESSAVRHKIPVITRNDIKLAFLSYTYGSNRGLPSDSGRINVINRDLIAKDIKQARKIADVIVVGMHWGVERSRYPSVAQTALAKFLTQQKVDIIYGTHQHVLQQPEWLEGPDKHQTLYLPSLGNFLSIHTELIPHTLTGAIMGVEIIKSPDGKISLENPFAIPTWNYYSPAETDFLIIPFDSVTDSQFRFGDFSAHRRETASFLKQRLPGLKILGLKDFGETDDN